MKQAVFAVVAVVFLLGPGCIHRDLPLQRAELTDEGFRHDGVGLVVPSVDGHRERFINAGWSVRHPRDRWGRAMPQPIDEDHITLAHASTGAEIWLGVVEVDEGSQSLSLDVLLERVLGAAAESQRQKDWIHRENAGRFELIRRDTAELTVAGKEAHGVLVDIYPEGGHAQNLEPNGQMVLIFIRPNERIEHRLGHFHRGVPALIAVGVASPTQHFERMFEDFQTFLATLRFRGRAQAAPADASSPPIVEVPPDGADPPAEPPPPSEDSTSGDSPSSEPSTPAPPVAPDGAI